MILARGPQAVFFGSLEVLIVWAIATGVGQSRYLGLCTVLGLRYHRLKTANPEIQAIGSWAK